MLDRRRFLQTSTLTVGALAMGPSFWSRALAEEPVRVGPGHYGPLGAANASGVAVPAGFSVRTVAAGGQPVDPSPFVLPLSPDGSASFALPDGGWVLVVNSEVPGGQGGASAIQFAADGAIRAAQRILGGTSVNCAGSATPWGTWLSCEEVDKGFVFECDPMGVRPAVRHDALGVFKHEAACVDPGGQRLYLTEDVGDSGIYRFTPDAYPSLARGVLEVAADGGAGLVTWQRVPDPTAATTPTRYQVPGTLRFARGEGIFFDTGIVYEGHGLRGQRTVPDADAARHTRRERHARLDAAPAREQATPGATPPPGTPGSTTTVVPTGPPVPVPGAPVAGPTPAFALRAKPAARLATLRRSEFTVTVHLLAGAAPVRLIAGGRTVAIGRAQPRRPGRVRVTLRVTKATRTLRGRRIPARLVLTQARRRITKPIVLTTPGGDGRRITKPIVLTTPGGDGLRVP